MLTHEQYADIKARKDQLLAWVDSIRSRRMCSRCHGRIAHYPNCNKCQGKGYVLGWASYKPEDKPASVPSVTNAELSAMEVYEFCANPPERYFLYVEVQGHGYGIVTTWTGDLLGHFTHGREYRSSFGDVRVPITVKAINGRTYHGIYYESAGSYARIKMSKASSKAR
jgi:hypothetical protein